MPITPNLTGRKRHRVQQVGLFRKRLLLVLQYEAQYEAKGFVPEYHGGPSMDGITRSWWVDAKPEWELISTQEGE